MEKYQSNNYEVANADITYLELHRTGAITKGKKTDGYGTEKTHMLEWLTIAHIDSLNDTPPEGNMTIKIPVKAMKDWGLISDGRIAQTVSRLHSQMLNIRFLLQKGKRTTALSPFPAVTYDESEQVVEVTVLDLIVPYLTKLTRRFTSHSLQILFKELDGLWARKIYGILKNHYPKSKPLEITLEDFRARLGAEQKCPLYHDFKKYILDPAEKEINNPKKGCDIRYIMTTERKGRRVHKLIFAITEVESKQQGLGISPQVSNLTDRTHSTLDMCGFWSAEKSKFEPYADQYSPELVEKAVLEGVERVEMFKKNKGYGGMLNKSIWKTIKAMISQESKQEQQDAEEEVQKAQERALKVEQDRQRREAVIYINQEGNREKLWKKHLEVSNDDGLLEGMYKDDVSKVPDALIIATALAELGY